MSDPPARRPNVPAPRLIGTLALAGALAGLAIVFVHQWTEPRIQAHRAAALRAAIQEVLGGPESYRTLWVEEGRLLDEPPTGSDTASLDRVYLGRDSSDRAVGFAVAGELPGYQDVIRLIFGYDPSRRQVIGMKILESKETPGLGDKIEKDSAFVAQFAAAETPLLGVKPGRATGAVGEVDMISGATISSRTVIAIINERLEALGALLDGHDTEAAPRPVASAETDAARGSSVGEVPASAPGGGRP